MPEGALREKRRRKKITLPRYVAMALIREQYPEKFFREIGAHFGGFDHSTVIQGIQTIKERISNDPDFAFKISQIRKRIADYKAVETRSEFETHLFHEAYQLGYKRGQEDALHVLHEIMEHAKPIVGADDTSM